LVVPQFVHASKRRDQPTPPETRDAVRLLLVDSATGAIQDTEFAEVLDALQPGDLLVVNDAVSELVGRGDADERLQAPTLEQKRE
jgi:S-adenosylmethionine:tRNA-ribosyltransferase-isomerase (queuine synthetase)